MVIAEINTVNYGSTGNIMLNVAEIARRHEHETYTFSRAWFSKKPSKCINDQFFGYRLDNAMHRVVGPIVGLEGCFSYVGTRALISKLQKIHPDVIQIHNLHGWYINLPLLFNYIKKNNIRVVWTLHDCWAFTGHCPCFTMAKCEKWQTECRHCPQYRDYPQSYLDNSRRMYRLKKKWFTGVKDLTIVTPSEWLAGLVKQSFLKEYPVKVINNGIDLSIFKPTDSDFRAKYNIGDKHIVLGVAFGWGKRKGLDVFVELAQRLDAEKYQIVLVGTDDSVDALLPENVISIHRTQNQTELAEIYTAADVFANPTREEVFGLVNTEALACGTPGVTFNSGGSPECYDETCGVVVPCDDIDAMEKEIIRICEDHPYNAKSCMDHAKKYSNTIKFEEYIKLYEEA